MDGLVPLTVVGAVLFCFGMRGIVLDKSRTPDPELVLDGVEDFVDGEPEWSDCSVGLWDQSRLDERIESAYLL